MQEVKVAGFPPGWQNILNSPSFSASALLCSVRETKFFTNTVRTLLSVILQHPPLHDQTG